MTPAPPDTPPAAGAAGALNPTSSSSPTLTPVPLSLILADFPLSIGATWVYSAEITYQNPEASDQLASWTGLITDTVMAENRTADGNLIFSMQEDMEPGPPPSVWRKPGTYEYIVSGDGVFDGDNKIYQWPLADQVTWEAMPDLGYVMNVNFMGNVVTPYGELKGCYQFFLATHPDASIYTFCPGTGFMEYYYQHFGTPQVEHFLLVAYIPGR